MKALEICYQTNQHYAARFAPSGLLTCSECGKKLHCRTHGSGGYRRWKVFSLEAGTAAQTDPGKEQTGVYKPGHAVEEITKIERQIEAIEKKAEEKAVKVETRAEFMVKF